MKQDKKIRTNISGIYIRSGSYFLRKRIGNGERIQEALGSTELINIKQAEDLAIEIIRKVQDVGLASYKALDQSKKSRNIGHNKLTLGDASYEFLDEAQRFGTAKTSGRAISKNTVKTYKKQLNGLLKEYLSLPIETITDEHIQGWYSKWIRKKNKLGKDAVSNAKQALTVLRLICNYSIGRRYIAVNPCEVLYKSNSVVAPTARKEDKDKRLNIDNHELGSFLISLINYQPLQNKRNQQTSIDLIVLALLSGARAEEMMHLQWSWLEDTNDFRSYTAPRSFLESNRAFQGTKTDVDYYYPCSLLVQDMMKKRFKNRYKLAERLKGNAPLKYVFPNFSGKDAFANPRRTLERICDSAGIKQISLHNFRNTFTDICMTSKDDETEFPDRIIKRATHHKDSDITFNTYGRSEADKLQLHQIYQHVEDFCSQSLGGGTITDIFGDAHSWSGTRRISKDATGIVDERVSSKAELRNALYNEDYDFDYPIPVEEVGEREKIKIKERLGLDEDLEFKKWSNDKDASNDLSDWDKKWNEMVEERLLIWKRKNKPS